MGSGSLTHPGWQPLSLTTASLSASPLRADAVLLSVAESLSGELFCGVPPFERDQAACATDGGGPANSVVFGWSQIWHLATEGDRRKAALGRSRLMFVHPDIVQVFDTRRGVSTFTTTGRPGEAVFGVACVGPDRDSELSDPEGRDPGCRRLTNE